MDFLKAAAAIEEPYNEFFTKQFCEKAKGKTENFVFSCLYAHTAAGTIAQILPTTSGNALASKLGLAGLFKDQKLDSALTQWYNRLKTIREFAVTKSKIEIPQSLKLRSALKEIASDKFLMDMSSHGESSASRALISIVSNAEGIKTKFPLRFCGKKSFKTLAGKKIKVDFVEATSATVRQGSFSGFTATEIAVESEASLALVLILPRSKEQFSALLDDPNYILSACGAGGGDASWQMSSQTIRFPAIASLQSEEQDIISIDSEDCKKLFRNRDKSSETPPNAGISIFQSSSIGFDFSTADQGKKEKSKSKAIEWTVDGPFFIALTWKRASSRTILSLAAIQNLPQ